MEKKLKDKVVIVTGGGSGIGRSSALIFTREGAKVVIADIDIRGSEETIQIIQGFGGEATFIRTDVSNSAEVESLVVKTVEHYGRLDCAHNNAGIFGVEPSIDDLAEDYWDRMMNINLKGIYLCMKYEISQMLKQGSGSIVNTSSENGFIGMKNLAAYTASKHGVNGLTKATALDYADRGIRINAVCPGLTLTPPVERDIKSNTLIVDQLTKESPIGRMGKPEEIGEAVLWLCSDAASFVTGLCMAVDGGFTAK